VTTLLCDELTGSHVCTEPYILNCHGCTKGMYHCALENIRDFGFP